MEDLAKWLLALAAGSSVVAYLGRVLIAHIFSRDIERFRADLQKESSKQLEQLRADLEATNLEHRTKFEWLHAQRAPALTDLHDLWLRASWVTTEIATRIQVQRSVGLDVLPMGDTSPATDAVAACRGLENGLRDRRTVIPSAVETVLLAACEDLLRIALSETQYERYLNPAVSVTKDGVDAKAEEMTKLAAYISDNVARIPDLDRRVIEAIRASIGADR